MAKEMIIAQELAKKQREISVSEFFTKNRHLLGFDNPTRALLMTVKEAVDNSLDACTEAKILPEIKVEIKKLAEDRFKVIVEDNGPGIVKEQIPRIFAKLLYGSKFHRIKMNRGQQGIGISASVLYSQLTTGKASVIISKIHKNKPAHYYELKIDTAKNEPLILKDEIKEWNKEHGTRIEIELEAKYQKGRQSVDEFIKGVAIVNPQAKIVYITPENENMVFDRATEELPIEAKEIMPHPYGIELGTLIKMLAETSARTLQGFLTTDFCRIGPGTAKEMCDKAG
ncbi:MAG: DNA topoisomerase VI subunit B, partial [Nanoarchaeota archaeon]